MPLGPSWKRQRCNSGAHPITSSASPAVTVPSRVFSNQQTRGRRGGRILPQRRRAARCGKAVSLTPTRVAAPWKCSRSIWPIGVGHRAKDSIIVSIASSLNSSKEARLPIVECPFGIGGVEHAIELAVGHRADCIHRRRPDHLKWPHRFFARIKRSTVTRYQDCQLGARAIGSVNEPSEERMLVRQRRGMVAEGLQYVAGAVKWKTRSGHL